MSRFLICCLWLCLLICLPAQADEGYPVNLLADEIVYDDQAQVVAAYGNVELESRGRILTADMVQYDLAAGRALAIGNVSLMEPSGEVLFTDYMELAKDLSDGFIENIQIVLSDDSRMAALSGERINGERKVLRGAVFTPCKICEGDKNPLWQVKAREVIHDEVAQDIIYRDTFLEVYGVPIAYSPYLSHPDPTVKRRSGILTPRYTTSSGSGTTLRVPYYYEISDYQDLVYEPIYVSKDGLLHHGKYRRELDNGYLNLGGSVGYLNTRLNQDKERTTRWHIDSDGLYELTDNWRFRFDINRASDSGFLRRYDFTQEDTIRSNASFEHFTATDYGVAEILLFQGLRPTDDNETTANAFPHLYHESLWKSHRVPGTFHLSLEQMNLMREQGADSLRSSVEGKWTLPLYGAWGQLVQLESSVRGDNYVINDTIDPVTGRRVDETEFRLYPSFKATWKWPFSRYSETFGGTQVIEPIVQGVINPNSVNEDIIPNEDSQSFEFDETNLFSTNRFSGVDRISEGMRADYGVKLAHYAPGGFQARAFIGQSYREREDSSFGAGSGVEENFSDIVGSMLIRDFDNYRALYRFRFDSDSGNFQRNEASVSGKYSIFRGSVDYIAIDNTRVFNNIGRREEISGRIYTRLTDTWTISNGLIRDIADSDTRRWDAGLIYQDECFRIAFAFTRNFTDDGETEPADSFGITFALKHLGGEWIED